MYITHQPTRDRIGQNITMDSYNFECVRQFQYLGGTIYLDNDSNEEIEAQIHSGTRCFFFIHAEAEGVPSCNQTDHLLCLCETLIKYKELPVLNTPSFN